MSKEQFLASSPFHSCWITASAGSGKTKVLIDRILRLLINGEPINSILCITYTNAAALEMRERLSSKLLELSKKDEIELKKILIDLTGNSDIKNELIRAKNLYEEFINDPSLIKISTIHSFCSDVLKDFSFELDIFEKIEVMQPYEALKQIQSIQEKFLEEGIDKNISNYFSTLLTHFSFEEISEILAELSNKRYEFANFLKNYNAVNYKEFLTNNFLKDFENCDFNENIVQDISKKILENCTLGVSDKKFIDNVINKKYKDAFLTTSNSVRKKILTNDILSKFAKESETLQDQSLKFYKSLAREQNEKMINNTQAIIFLGQIIFDKYQNLKKTQNIYDFEDLIMLTNKLIYKMQSDKHLKESFNKRYNIKHIFLDEAQDTSPQQWQIILNLVESFFDKDSTLFVVGDIKQSIYSFQGARPWLFCSLEKVFQKIIENNKGKWQKISLTKSYRTTSSILEIVDKIFENDKTGIVFEGEYERHSAARKDIGFVKTINIEKNLSDDETIDYESVLAKTVSDSIKDLLEKNLYIPSMKRKLIPDDILILTRKRGKIIKAIVDELEKNKIPTSGQDVIKIYEHLIWKDLLAFVRFLALPYYDYNLACVLKSPFYKISEDELFSICYERRETIFEGEFFSNSKLRVYYDESLKNFTSTDWFNFFYKVLVDVQEDFCQEFGNLANEAFEIFIDEIYKFFNKNTPNIHRLLIYLEEIRPEIKVSKTSGVKFMTVHGSKGLQSPIVYLIDQPNNRLLQKETFAWFDGEGFDNENLVLMPTEAFSNEFALKIRNDIKNKIIEENRRLLYVAMTRAQDGLISIGNTSDDNWHKMIFDQACEFYGMYEYSNDKSDLKFEQKKRVVRPETTFLIKEENEESSSQETKDSDYGILIHELIEKLKDDNFSKDLAIKFLINKSNALNIDENIIKDIDLDKIFEIRKIKEFDIIKKSESEVSFLHEGNVYRVDHLYVGKDDVYIFEVKSSRKKISNIDEIEVSYINQLTNYYKIVSKVFPEKNINAYFLWVETQKLIKLNI